MKPPIFEESLKGRLQQDCRAEQGEDKKLKYNKIKDVQQIDNRSREAGLALL